MADTMIGQGMAGAIYNTLAMAGTGAGYPDARRFALVEAGTHDLGTGYVTVLQQMLPRH